MNDAEMTRSGVVGVLSRLWETSLLRPAIVVVRVLLTVGFGIVELGLLVALIRSDNWAEASAAGAGMVLTVILYFILMLIPDLWAILLSWESSVGRGAPPRGWYRGLFLASDLGRLAAVSVLVAGIFNVMEAMIPAMFRVHGGLLPGWWKVWLAMGLLAILGYAGWKIALAARGSGERRLPSGWAVLGFVSLIALELVIEGNVAVAGLGEAVFLAAAAVAGMETWRRICEDDLPRAVAAGGVAVALGLPALVRLGDLRNLPAGLASLCSPWWDLFVAPSLKWMALLMGGAIGFGAPGTLFYVVALLLIAALAALGAWIRSDVMRTLVRVGEGLTGERQRRVGRPALMLLRMLALAVLAAGLVWIAILSQTHAWALQDLPGGAGALFGSSSSQLGLVLLWGLGLLGLVDVFQMAEDAAAATARDVKPKILDFKWLKALIGLMTAALWLGGTMAVLTWITVLVKGGPRWGAVGLIVAVPVVLWFLVLSILPRFIRNLLKVEANTRPEGRSRVAVAAGFPGISAYQAWGRFMAWLAVLAVLAGTGLTAAALSNQVDTWGLVGIVVGGLLATIVTAIVLGSIPDFLSLLLTVERNLRDGSALAEIRFPFPGERLEEGGTDEAAGGGMKPLPELLEEAVLAMGDRLAAPPIVPPGRGGVVLEAQGSRGRYAVTRRGGKLVLYGPGGSELGHFHEGRFVPGGAIRKEGMELDAISWGDGVYRTPALPVEELPVRERPGPAPARPGEEPAPAGRSRDEITHEPTVAFDEVELVGLGEELETPFETADAPPPILVPEAPSPGHEAAPPPAAPLVDVERTPKVGQGASKAPAEAPAPPPHRAAPGPPRASRRKEPATTHLVSIPVAKDTEGERVLAALTEILLVKHEVRGLSTGVLRSRLAGSSVELEGVGLDPATESRLRRTFRDELEHTLQFAASLMEANVFELKRFLKQRAQFRRSARGQILAPGWTGGGLPPLSGFVVSRADGKTLYRGKLGRRYGVKFVVRQREALVVYGVRM